VCVLEALSASGETEPVKENFATWVQQRPAVTRRPQMETVSRLIPIAGEATGTDFDCG
jgi:hypothetical protein